MGISFEKDMQNKNKTLQDILEEFMEMFAKIKFHSTQREMWGVQKVVILTTTSIIWLKDKLFEEENGITVFSPGKVLGNAVENVHTQIREMDSHPTPVKFMRIVKALFMSNLLKRPNAGSSYEDDGATCYLAEFRDIKKIEEEKMAEQIEDEDYFIAQQYEPGDFDDVTTLMHHAGYVLKKCIKNDKYKCKTCIPIWIDKDNHDLENSLIDAKEHSEGALTRPSKLANKVFCGMEAMFQRNREEYQGRKNQVDILKVNILENLNYELPDCHVKKIVGRWLTNRMHFWASFKHKEITADAQTKIAMREAAHASRTTIAKAVIH